MLENYLWPELDELDINDMWFQQDGATSHTARVTIDLLKGKLENLIDFIFLHVCVESTKNFLFKIWETVEKMKTDVDRLILVSKFKKIQF